MSVPLANAAIIVIWSTTPLAIKWSSVGAGVTFAAMARMLIGGVLALGLVAVFRIGLPVHSRARRAYLVSGLGAFGNMICTYWGAQYIHSGLVSVLFGLSPLVTGVFAVLWLGEPALKPARVAGMLLALAGLATIFTTTGDALGANATAGILAVLAAVVCYSASLVGVKRIADDSPPLATTAGSLVVSLPLFALAWLAADGHVPEAMSSRTIAAIVYLGALGSVLGFALYNYVIKHMEAGKVALITLITPVLALLLGHAANGEAVDAHVWVGSALITFGLVVHQWDDGAARWVMRRLPIIDKR